MIRRIIKIIIIFTLSLNFLLPVLFAQNQLNDGLQQISQDAKDRQRQLKQFEMDTKRNFDQMRQDQRNQRIIQESNRAINKREAKQTDQKPKEDIELSNFLKANIFQILLIIFAFGLLIFSFRLITREERRLRKGETIFEDEIIARVDSWVFEKGSFKNYAGVLGVLVDPQVINTNSREFRRSFLDDLATTEILCQVAVERKLGEDSQTKNMLLNYEEYLAKIDIKNPEIKKSITDYSLRLPKEYLPYVYYYKDFLNILLLAGSRVQSKSFEAFSRSILVKKLIEDIANKPQVGGDPLKIQAELDLLIKDYISRFRVVINSDFSA